MSYVADLHLHSSYAYATSKALTLPNLAKWAKLKGIDLLASADFTHPQWFRELSENLIPEDNGLYQYAGVHFVLGAEVSCIYSQDGRGRRIHILLFAPNLSTVEKLNQALAPHGNLAVDGRPTLTLSVRDLTELVLETDPRCVVVPAHAWTPWYGVFGSKSGFDSLEECFQDLTPAIPAVETGLSSDPAMNWGVPNLAGKTIISFSDAHSLPKLARELTVFNGPLTYQGLSDALFQNRVAYTVEFYPEEGKYHYDGHRKCHVCQPPGASLEQRGLCPVCHRPLTLGVLHRTRSLSAEPVSESRAPDGFIHSPDGRPPFTRLVPLQEIIAQVLGQGLATKGVTKAYFGVINELGSELQTLLHASPADLALAAGEPLARAILQARRGDVQVSPGYDGVFGTVSLPPESPDFPASPVDQVTRGQLRLDLS